MAQTLANVGDTVYGSVINQVINVLQQLSGGQELGKYKIQGNNYTATGLFQSCPIITRSRNTTPISLSIDTADQTTSNLNAPSTGHLTMGGAQIFASATAIAAASACAGNWTMQY